MERRAHKGGCEVRQGGSGPMLVGYAATFNEPSQDLGGFIETIDPQCFAKTVTEADVRGLGNHDVNWLLGRTKPGTMRLATDAVGLRYEIDINPEDPDGQRALAKVKRGDWDGSSFGFTTIRDEWNWNAQPVQRRLLEVALADVGPVTYPAYLDTSVAARALERVAAKLKKPVDELVDAMRSGHIRSLIDAPAPTERTEPVFTFETREARAGKSISAATAETLRAAIRQIQSLLDGSDGPEPAATNPGDEMGDGSEGTNPQGAPTGNYPALSGTNSLERDVQLRTLAALAEFRAIPDMGGDPANMEAMAGAVVAAYHAKLTQLGLEPCEDGFLMHAVADQDGDRDGDGPTLWKVLDDNAKWYILANGGSADVIAFEELPFWCSPMMDIGMRSEFHMSPDLAQAMLRMRERDQEAIEAGIDIEHRAATGSTTLPLGTRNEIWDAGKAAKSLDPKDFPKAFFWVDPAKPADEIGSYKLGFAEELHGTGSGEATLHAVWGGVTAVAGVLKGARGGVDIPAADVPGVKAKVEAYYKKAAKQYGDDSITVPW